MAKRKYQEAWETLRDMLAVKMQLMDAGGTDLSRRQFYRYVATVRKAMQKEKYADVNFRLNNPNAKIESVVDEEQGTITFALKLNNYRKVNEELFDAKSK